jgi:hypothetical protein
MTAQWTPGRIEGRMLGRLGPAGFRPAGRIPDGTRSGCTWIQVLACGTRIASVTVDKERVRQCLTCITRSKRMTP